MPPRWTLSFTSRPRTDECSAYDLEYSHASEPAAHLPTSWQSSVPHRTRSHVWLPDSGSGSNLGAPVCAPQSEPQSAQGTYVSVLPVSTMTWKDLGGVPSETST